MTRRRSTPLEPQAGWAIYLRTSSDENQKPELSRSRQRYSIEKNVLERSDMPVFKEYVDVLSGKTPNRTAYQQMLNDARAGLFSHVVVERADRFGRNDTEALRAIDELHEFGVAVRFANQPDLNPMDPDDRVIVALSFTLARRESALLGIRVQGGLQAKREKGGFCGRAPDGYVNVSSQTTGEAKRLMGRHEQTIEQDPKRAKIWRLAWDLLLQDTLTLDEIAEELHRRGYRHRSGRPFVVILADGSRKRNISTLSHAFRNWAYAGWIVSKKNNIPGKTIRGDWEPIVTTEEFERGLAILEARNQRRSVRRRQDYLLKGLIYYRNPQDCTLHPMTGSTSNAGRAGGGTAYYRIARAGGVSFMCRAIDVQIPDAVQNIQVNPEYIPLIREAYTDELAERLGLIRPDDRAQIEAALREIEDEETRMARLFAARKVSQPVWDSLWREWQDRRRQLLSSMEALEKQQDYYIDNLDTALEIIANIGNVYNSLEYDDQKQLLKQIVHRVIVNHEGMITLELRAPFAYLSDLRNGITGGETPLPDRSEGKTKTGRKSAGCVEQCSNWLQLCGEDRSTSEHRKSYTSSKFLGYIAYPHRASAPIFSTTFQS